MAFSYHSAPTAEHSSSRMLPESRTEQQVLQDRAYHTMLHCMCQDGMGSGSCKEKILGLFAPNCDTLLSTHILLENKWIIKRTEVLAAIKK